MPATTTRRPAIRSLDGWAIATLRETGAIVECEPHGWMREYGDPHARIRALRIGRDDPPPGSSASDAVAAIEKVLAGIGDTCPDCTRESLDGDTRDSNK
ncbi:hypothetical protein LQG66_13605 [Bradyrhizobium ontarionense]|uniref:Uncharacterized protein n=1 Tax=Bradyrhizobium ontarionense TaxID=2898149 RepID=A0ABY3RKW5_9BRAD|nr:hypothetical protein [Bradyrhizobium sp. A19]UFZ07274.1 hypothetical protein LQG66_13605 [Bradyrhizobium sp. A19]